MVQIEAFRGIRYDLGHVGSLSDVIAPPYDVINPEFQDSLYKQHPANVIRLELNREEPGDDATNNRYSRAARFLKNWQNEGILKRDSTPALYVYHQIFDYSGHTFVRRGFMARVRLERFGEGRIYPHEETHASAKQDRLLLTTACRANLSQIFGIYPDSEPSVQSQLEQAIQEITPLEAVDHLGVIHRLWPVIDRNVISAVTTGMGDKPMFIADGHHRYETACNYRDQLAATQPLPSNHPAHSVLMMCIGMNDPGLIVFPTHRLFRGVPLISSQELAERIGGYFDLVSAGEGAEAARGIWSQIERANQQGKMAFFTQADRRWTLATINPSGRAKMAEVASDHHAEWQGLGVSILHRLVIENLLQAKNLPKAHYVHLVEEVVEGLELGDPEGGHFPLGVLVMPATVNHVRAISEHWERMPAKSTYFYPKLLSGLVINPLE